MKVFALLLYALPRAFRQSHGTQMRRDFEEASFNERESSGVFGMAAFALCAYADVLATALSEHSATLFRDGSYAVRSLRKTPFFAAVVVATLAVAIGANATAFSVLRGVVLAPLPYADASRLVSVTVSARGKPFGFSIPAFLDVSEQNRTLSSLAAYYPGGDHTLTAHGQPVRSPGSSHRRTSSTSLPSDRFSAEALPLAMRDSARRR